MKVIIKRPFEPVGVDGEEFTDVPIGLDEWEEMLIGWGNEV